MLLLFLISNISFASDYLEKLNAISEYAEKICNSLPLSGEKKGLELNGEAKAELEGLLGKLAGISVSGKVDYTDGSYKGVLQEDLGDLFISNADCKNKVAERLEKRLLSSSDGGYTSSKKKTQPKICTPTTVNPGLTLSALDSSDWELYDLPVGQTAISRISSVDQPSVWYSKGLRAGDFILRANGIPVDSTAGFSSQIYSVATNPSQNYIDVIAFKTDSKQQVILKAIAVQLTDCFSSKNS